MKQSLLITVALIICTVVNAQTTKRLQKQTDTWGLEYTYTGEVKNGKPNGMGVAKYTSGNVVRYVGSFVNGVYSGRGTMLFDNGAFLTGTWSNGKLNGKGSNLTQDGALYIGDFADGLKNGKGIIIYKNNSFVKGGFKEDKMSGRCINLWEDGTIISDVVYADDKRNGTGYQYEAKSKTTYAGEWKDDKWVQSASPYFSSFVKQPGFIGEKTDSHVLIGPVTDKGFLKDTAYYYDLVKLKRYFGYYQNGKLTNGLILRDDSTRFMGGLDDVGATGYCYDFKYKSYYSEGNFKNDLLNGEITDIDLVKKSVYYGNAIDGIFTGKAYFFNDKNSMYAGDYVKGNFTGSGYRLEGSGRCVTGIWDDGEPTVITSITLEDGTVIPGSPKTLQDALNIAVKTYPGFFDDITGSLADYDDLADIVTDDNDEGYTDIYKSLISFPGKIRNDYIESDIDYTNLYVSVFINTKDAAKATAKYNEIAKQLMAASFTNSYIPKAVKLKGTITPVNIAEDKTETKLDLATDNDKYKDFHVWLILEKSSADEYSVTLKIGEKEEE